MDWVRLASPVSGSWVACTASSSCKVSSASWAEAIWSIARLIRITTSRNITTDPTITAQMSMLTPVIWCTARIAGETSVARTTASSRMPRNRKSRCAARSDIDAIDGCSAAAPHATYENSHR